MHTKILKEIQKEVDIQKEVNKTVVKRKFPEKEEKIKEINGEPFDIFCRNYICVLLQLFYPF